MDSNASVGGLDSAMAPFLSDLQTFQNEKFYLNLTQVLNISAENLTTLLLSMQGVAAPWQPDQEQQETALLGTQTSLSLLTALSVCYALIFVAGVLGNLITCIVISRNNFMHTATNFYLFNLAISDLILLCSGMPQDLYNLWQPNNYPFSDGICIMESVLSETAANATVLTITAFTVERYIAICHPFRQHTMSKLSRAIKFIFAIWIAALLLALPQAIQFSVVPLPLAETGSSCTMKNDLFAHVFVVSGFLFFGGPMTAICVLYVLIGVKLKRSRLLQALPRRSYDIHRCHSAQTRVIRMLVAVAVAFFICWAPFHAQRLMAVYGSAAGIESPIFNDIFNILNYTSGVLYFLSTCINPLLYNIMSHKFREAFKVTLARHFRLSRKYQSQSQPNNYYSALRRNQRGSIRLHTTDSMRTTMTTTTTSGAGNGARYSQRLHRISLDGSHATLLSTQSKQDLFAAPIHVAIGTAGAAPPAHRILQSQISQLSSVGDAHSLLEAEIDGCGTAYRSRRGKQQSELELERPNNIDARSVHSHTHSWPEPEEFELVSARHRPQMCAIAELGQCPAAMSRSRLKLTRITRLPQETQSTTPTPTPPPPPQQSVCGEHGSVGKLRKKAQNSQKTSSALKSLKAKFNWRSRRKARRAQSGVEEQQQQQQQQQKQKPQLKKDEQQQEQGVY